VGVWERGETMQGLVWKPETNRSLEEVSVEARMKINVNRLLGRRWCKCKGKYKIDLQVILWERMDLNDLAQMTNMWCTLFYMLMSF
jgi:hypothetical protein